MTIEQVNAFLREVTPDDWLARDTLCVAIEWIVPGMASETIRWIVLMLRDLAYSADAGSYFAGRMQIAADALEATCSV